MIEYFNENKWIKFIATLLSLSPILSWAKLAVNVPGFNLSNNVDWFGLVTAIITTTLLLFVVNITSGLLKRIRSAEIKIEEQRIFTLSVLAHHHGFYSTVPHRNEEIINGIKIELKRRFDASGYNKVLSENDYKTLIDNFFK